MEKSEIRVFLRHYRKQGFNATSTAKKISEVEGYHVVSDRTARLVQTIQQRRHGPRGQDILKNNFEGVVHFESVPNGRTIDADLYYAPLDRMYAALGKRYPAFINRMRVPCNKTTQNLAPPNERRKRSKLSTPLNFFHTQHIVRSLRNTTITFSGPWRTFCVVVASMIWTMSKTDAASFSPL